MSDEKLIEKIAYCYYKKFQAFGEKEDRERDYRLAVKAIIHLKEDIAKDDYKWKINEEDYGEFRHFLKEE